MIRVVENDSKFIYFTEKEFNYFILNFSEFEKYDHDDDKNIILKKSTFNKEIYQFGNKNNREYPQYIFIGKNSLQTIFDVYDLIKYALQNKNTDFVKHIVFELVQRYRKLNRAESLKSFLLNEAEEYSGKNTLKFSIARDMHTNCYDFTEHIWENRITP